MFKRAFISNFKRWCTVISSHEEMAPPRYFKNPYVDLSVQDNSFLDNNQLKGGLITKVKTLDKFLFDKIENYVGNISRADDSTVYTGYSGIAYLYLSKYKKTNNEEYLQKAKHLIDMAISRRKGRDISFVLGDAGPLALGAVIYTKLGQSEVAKSLVDRLLELPSKIKKPPHEFLYGYAGFLYALLYLNNEIGPVVPEDCIRKIIQIILDDGQNNAKSLKFPAPLYYEWYDTNYLGAAHGVSGILYILLCASNYLDRDEKQLLIKPTIDWLSQNRFESGNFKSADERETDMLVHWCHGCPGVIYLYILASKVFNREEYMNIALECGEIVWKRGLLKKGYSICHGVSGNAYAFLHLFKETNNSSHLHRAACFADWCTKYPEAEGHRPDSPYSLFEGIAGLDYFLTDIQDLPNAAFPAFFIK